MDSNQLIVDLQKDLAVGMLPFFLTGSVVLTIVMLARRSLRQDLRHQSLGRWLACIIALVIVGTGIFFAGFYFLGYIMNGFGTSAVTSVFLPLLYAVQGLAQQLIIKFFLKPTVVGGTTHSPAVNPAKKAAILLAATLPVVLGLVFRYTNFEDTAMIYVILPIFIALPFIVIGYTAKQSK